MDEKKKNYNKIIFTSEEAAKKTATETGRRFNMRLILDENGEPEWDENGPRVLFTIDNEPNPDKLKETATRLYNFMDPWERCETTPEETAEEIKKNPLDAINYLLDMLEG